MNDGRKRISLAIAGFGVATLAGSVLVASPSLADPDIDDVEVRVEKLYRQAEQASERYNDARIDLKRSQRRLDAIRGDLAREQARVESVRGQVAASVVADYQGMTLSSTSRVLLAEDPDDFLEQLTTVAEHNEQQAQLMADFAARADRLERREEAAERELAKVARTKRTLATEKAEIDEKAAGAEELLDDLKAEERERVAAAPSRSGAAREPLTAAPASGRAGAAVSYALAQVGDAYVYGAAGPDAFDCSGLTMMAWAQAGVGLPHSSGAQMGSGTPVSQSELQPGDLVFYYSPVSHVGIYIGGGQIAHAANPGTGVAIAPVTSMPYAGAVRPG